MKSGANNGIIDDLLGLQSLYYQTGGAYPIRCRVLGQASPFLSVVVSGDILIPSSPDAASLAKKRCILF